MAITIEQIIENSKAADYSAEALAKDIKDVIGEAVRTKAESFESALGELGFEKPEGLQGREHMIATVNALKMKSETAETKNGELTAQVEKMSKATPKAEELEAQYKTQLEAKDTEIGTYKAQIEEANFLSRVAQSTAGFKYGEGFADSARKVLNVEAREVLKDFGTQDTDGVQVLTKNGVIHRDAEGRVVTLEAHLRTKMEPFFAKEATKNPVQPDPANNGGGAHVAKTNEQIREYAKANGIDILSTEGQTRIAEYKAGAQA